jgi:hypothetical protein
MQTVQSKPEMGQDLGTPHTNLMHNWAGVNCWFLDVSSCTAHSNDHKNMQLFS